MNRSLHLTTAAGVALIGLLLALLGARLAMLGGSPFYMLLGVGWLATAALLLQRTTGALVLFAAILIAIMGWALWDCGFQFWGLEVRLAIPTALGLWMLLVIRQPGRLPLMVAVAALLLLLSASFLSRERFEIHNATQRTACRFRPRSRVRTGRNMAAGLVGTAIPAWHNLRRTMFQGWRWLGSHTPATTSRK